MNVTANQGIVPREGVFSDEGMCWSVTPLLGDSFYKSDMKAFASYGPLLEIIR